MVIFFYVFMFSIYFFFCVFLCVFCVYFWILIEFSTVGLGGLLTDSSGNSSQTNGILFLQKNTIFL